MSCWSEDKVQCSDKRVCDGIFYNTTSIQIMRFMLALERSIFVDPNDCDIVYVITDGVGHYKVGISSRARLQRRLGDLQMGNALRLQIATYFLCDKGGALDIEQEAHHALRAHHVIGEWFKADLATITKGIKDAVHLLEKRRSGMVQIHKLHKDISKARSAELSALEEEDESRKSIFDMMREDTESYPGVRPQLRR